MQPLHKPWEPDRPVSKGATAYHEAVFNAEHYTSALDELAKIAISKINSGDIIVDFGAGTGVSALRLLNHLKIKIELWLVDNSAAWLGKAYEIFSNNPKVKCFLLEKKGDTYSTLADVVGRNKVNHVISANTMHLIPNLKYTFEGIAEAIKNNGTFTFQSGNIPRNNGPKGALMVDDTIKRVHDIALGIVHTDVKFTDYRKDIDARIKTTEHQRKFVFPDTRPIEVYLDALKDANFKDIGYYYKLVKVKYSDWLNFLRVRRLQAGILPEIGGHEPSPKEESDRDTLITLAAKKLFEELSSKNPLADNEGFIIDFVCVYARKQHQNSLTLSGKTALVTGASRGIGRAIAIELAKEGADVIVNYVKDGQEAAKVVEEIKNLSRKSIAIKADVSDFDEVRLMFESVKKEFGRLDILVNNAGIIMDKTLHNMDLKEWNTVIKVNLGSAYNVAKHALPLIRKRGRIINISSIVAFDGNFGQTNYAASKAGIIGFTKSLAKELGKNEITVNVIAPGFIETDILNLIPAARKNEFANMIPLGRIGEPEEIAGLVAFLASEMASYITGEVIRVDGGLNL